MDGKVLARIGAIIFIAIAITATVIEMTREEEPARLRSAPELQPEADPLRLIFDANLGPAIGVSIMDMGQRFRIVANVVDVVPTDEPLPNLPVARALWLPRPNLRTAAAAWIYAGGAHHTSFSYALTAEHLYDFAEMAGVEFLLIDENTRVDEFKDKLRWNDLYYHLDKAF